MPGKAAEMPGHIDTIDNYRMIGWACAEDRSRPCRIRVDVNGDRKYTFIPRNYRSDLAAAGFVEGYCSVSVVFPTPLTQSEPVAVEVWNEETGELLTKPGLVVDPEAGNQPYFRGSVAPDEASAQPGSRDLYGGEAAPCPEPGSWEAAIANLTRVAMNRISALEREAESAHAEIVRLREQVVRAERGPAAVVGPKGGAKGRRLRA